MKGSDWLSDRTFRIFRSSFSKLSITSYSRRLQVFHPQPPIAQVHYDTTWRQVVIPQPIFISPIFISSILAFPLRAATLLTMESVTSQFHCPSEVDGNKNEDPTRPCSYDSHCILFPAAKRSHNHEVLSHNPDPPGHGSLLSPLSARSIRRRQPCHVSSSAQRLPGQIGKCFVCY